MIVVFPNGNVVRAGARRPPQADAVGRAVVVATPPR